MITSTSNQKVRQVVQWQTKAKERRKSDIFLAEGFKMLEEAPQEWIREIYLSEDCLDKAKQNPFLWKKLLQTGYETVSEEVFRKMSDTQTPQGILAIVEQPAYQVEELLKINKKNPIVLSLLEDVKETAQVLINTINLYGLSSTTLSNQSQVSLE